MQWCYCIFSFLGKRGPGTTGNSYTLNFSLRLFFQRHHLCRFLGSESREKQRALVTEELWPKRSTGGITLGKTERNLNFSACYLEGRKKGTYLIICSQARHYCPLSTSLGPESAAPIMAVQKASRDTLWGTLYSQLSLSHIS